MNTAEKQVVKKTRRKITISREPARSRANRHRTTRLRREDLEYYLRILDEQDNTFTLPHPDSLRRDTEVLQRFMNMHEPPEDVVHEEFVIETEVTEIEKKNNLTGAAN